MIQKINVRQVDDRETLARLVKAYIDDDVMISPTDKKTYERLCAADDLIKDYHYGTSEARALALRKKFGISIATARKDLKMAADFFNDIDALDRSTGARVLMAQADKLLAMCEKVGDTRSMASIIKIKKDIYVDLVVNQPIDLRAIQQQTFIFNVGGRFRGMEADYDRAKVEAQFEKWGINTAERKKILEEIPFEEVPTKEQDTKHG